MKNYMLLCFNLTKKEIHEVTFHDTKSEAKEALALSVKKETSIYTGVSEDDVKFDDTNSYHNAVLDDTEFVWEIREINKQKIREKLLER